MTVVAVVIYIAAVVAANLLVAKFGPAVTPINAFFFIGLDLALRDHLHERWRGRGRGLAWRMLLLIATAGLISYLLNPASNRIALASCLAFTGSALADALVYALLSRRGYLWRSNGSNLVGALVDSILFPTLAFGGFLPPVVLGQFAAKAIGGGVWTAAFWLARKPKGLWEGVG